MTQSTVKPLYPTGVQVNEKKDEKEKKKKVTTNKNKVKPLPTTGNWDNFED